MDIIDCWSEGDYTEYETFKCRNCGRTQTLLSGGEPSCCPCEFEHEGDCYDKESQGFDVPDEFEDTWI